MIQSKNDYIHYLRADGIEAYPSWKGLFLYILPNRDIDKFKILLRTAEYHHNCLNNGLIGKLLTAYYKFRLYSYGKKLGFSIPINVFGPGLSLPHHGTIVVSRHAKIGANCRIHICVNIGASGGEKEAPQIGNNVYIAPGAKIFGQIVLADNIAVGANAVVNKSFREENITIGGIPAKKIADGGSKKAGWSGNHRGQIPIE